MGQKIAEVAIFAHPHGIGLATGDDLFSRHVGLVDDACRREVHRFQISHVAPVQFGQ